MAFKIDILPKATGAKDMAIELVTVERMPVVGSPEANDLSRAEECYREEQEMASESYGDDILKTKTWDSRSAKFIDATGSVGQHI